MRNWFDSLSEVITYIEEHLEEEIAYEELGKIMGYSVYHVQRLFLMITNVPISEYIRCRRLSQAAYDMQNSEEKIIDIAYKYGYSSPTSFNRAFKAFHGVTPKDIRKEEVLIKAYPPLSFELSVKGANAMDYRLVQMDAFKVVGRKIHTTTENGQSYQELPTFWQEIQQTGDIPQMLAVMNQAPFGLLGVSDYNPKLDQQAFDYYIGVSSSQPNEETYDELIVPAATWAAFPHKIGTPEEMQKFQNQIVMDWLPSSGYQFAFGPDLEVYGEGDMLETWIPVVKL